MKTVSQVIAELSKELPAGLIRTLPAKGSPDYVAHQDVKAILNTVCPNWRGEIKELREVAGKVVVVYRLIIPCVDGDIVREATGFEDGAEPDALYGDPFSNAEAMAFKRCVAWAGLGLKDLYKSKVPRPTYPEHTTTESEQAMDLFMTADPKTDNGYFEKGL